MKNAGYIANRRAAVISLLAAVLVLFAAPSGDGRLADTSKKPGIRYGRTASGYVYMNGGSSNEEQLSMERGSAQYNVKLVLVGPRAMPLSRLSIFIANNRIGKIENVPLSGPWLYFQLPAGSYTIGARVRNKLFVLRDIHVQNAGRQTHVLRADLLPSGVNQPKNNGGGIR